MSHKLPMLKARRVISVLERAGFVVAHHGDHVKLKHADGRIAIVPNHPGRDILPRTLESIIEQAGLTKDEFRHYL